MPLFLAQEFIFPLSFLITSGPRAFWRSVAAFPYWTGRWHLECCTLCVPPIIGALLGLGRVQRRGSGTPAVSLRLTLTSAFVLLVKEVQFRKRWCSLLVAGNLVHCRCRPCLLLVFTPWRQQFLEGFLLCGKGVII